MSKILLLHSARNYSGNEFYYISQDCHMPTPVSMVTRLRSLERGICPTAVVENLRYQASNVLGLDRDLSRLCYVICHVNMDLYYSTQLNSTQLKFIETW